MEVYPLQDTLPPRHQVESDESEDEDAYPPVGSYTRSSSPGLTVHFDWSPQKTRSNLLVALYEAGRCWVKGVVGLGDAQGQINLNATLIGRIYLPQWADILVIVIDTRVPLYAMHAIVSTVISFTAPKSLCLIDSYPLPSYVSVSTPSSNSKPPIRCLQTHAKPLLHKISPFSTPNILQCLAAAFLSFAQFQKLSTTLLLLPSSYMTPSAPPNIVSGTFGPSVKEEWEASMMEELHKYICATLDIEFIWKINSGTNNLGKFRASRIGDVGEGSMYL